jgi:hypothetical protein
MFRTRPFSVTLLLWVVLMLIMWGALRFFASLQWRGMLVEYESSLSVGYLSVTGAGWGLAGGVLLWGLFTAKAWTRPTILIAIIVWLVEYWVERLFFESRHINWPFAAVVSLLVLGITLVSTLHHSTKDFLTRSEEYEQQNKSPGS